MISLGASLVSTVQAVANTASSMQKASVGKWLRKAPNPRRY
jgi:hypothetical protein